MVQYTNQHILMNQPNYSCKWSIIFTCLLCLVGVLWNNQQSLEELWDADGDCIKQSHSVMYQRCILEQTKVVSIKFCTFICRNLEGISEVPTTNYIHIAGVNEWRVKN